MIALLLVSALAFELRAGVTPVQRVLGLMRQMKADGAAEMKKEADLHAEYGTWCKATANTKEDAIREGAARMSKLRASVQKADADAARLGDEVAALDGEISKMTADKQASQELRAKERADFEAVHKDYSESVDAMASALNTLRKVSADKANPALIQSTLASLPEKARAVVNGFLQTDDAQPAQAASYAYSSSVGSVVDMISDLAEKLGGERADLERSEEDAQHAYRMLQQELTMSLETSTDERDTKSERKAQRVSTSGRDSGDLAETTATHDEDVKYLAELTALCGQKASDFAARQQLRSEELDAVQQAIDIIADQAVSGAADTHLPALLQTKSKRSFALLRSSRKVDFAKVAAALRSTAARTQSRTLAAVALQVQAGGHFDKITQMIKDMITKLTEEANEEAEHKGWCDGELKQNKQTRDAKTESIDELMAQSELLSAEIAKLAEDMADLSAQIAELDASLAAATSQRQKEKAANTQAVADAKVAQQAVRSALTVLKDFYAKAAKATALVQQQGPGDDAPQSFDTPYRGMGGKAGGVVGMLDVILSDFVRLEEETSAEEASADREFGTFASEANADRSVQASSLDSKSKLKTKKAKELNQAGDDLSRTQAELGSAQDYHAELKTACVDANVSFKERVERREEEIESLKEALKALSDE